MALCDTCDMSFGGLIALALVSIEDHQGEADALVVAWREAVSWKFRLWVSQWAKFWVPAYGLVDGDRM